MRAGVVIGRPSRVVISSGVERRGGGRGSRGAAPRPPALTCIAANVVASIRHAAPALQWLSAAPTPHARTAAHCRPSSPITRWPTAYTPAVHGMQPPAPDPPVDRRGAQPERQQLRSRDHAALAPGDGGDLRCPGPISRRIPRISGPHRDSRPLPAGFRQRLDRREALVPRLARSPRGRRRPRRGAPGGPCSGPRGRAARVTSPARSSTARCLITATRLTGSSPASVVAVPSPRSARRERTCQRVGSASAARTSGAGRAVRRPPSPRTDELAELVLPAARCCPRSRPACSSLARAPRSRSPRRAAASPRPRA